MKLFTSSIFQTLVFMLDIPTAMAYLPSISAIIERAKSNQSLAANTPTQTSASKLAVRVPNTRWFKRQVGNTSEAFAVENFNSTPGRIPAAYLIKPRTECSINTAEMGDGHGGQNSGAEEVYSPYLRVTGVAVVLSGVAGAAFLL
jgi:hypothetical protein